VLIEAREKVAKLKKQGRTLEDVIAAKPTARYERSGGRAFRVPSRFWDGCIRVSECRIGQRCARQRGVIAITSGNSTAATRSSKADRMPASRVTERVFMAILRAVVDLGLASGASPRSTERRAMSAICGYLLYSG
jgi:hypothetical protein